MQHTARTSHCGSMPTIGHRRAGAIAPRRTMDCVGAAPRKSAPAVAQHSVCSLVSNAQRIQGALGPLLHVPECGLHCLRNLAHEYFQFDAWTGIEQAFRSFALGCPFGNKVKYTRPLCLSVHLLLQCESDTDGSGSRGSSHEPLVCLLRSHVQRDAGRILVPTPR